MNKSDTIKRVWKVIEIAKRMAIETRDSLGYTVENHLEEISIYNYSEPGYDKDQLVALGNWNEITKYNKATNTREVISNLPCRIADIFEKMNIECEWSDEWTSCCDCGRIVRTQADSYSWTPSFHIHNDCELICHKCTKEDSEEYFSDLEDDNSEDFLLVNCHHPDGPAKEWKLEDCPVNKPEIKSVCPQCKECKECEGTGILIFEFYTRKCGCMLR